jgi:hypothetical protein
MGIRTESLPWIRKKNAQVPLFPPPRYKISLSEGHKDEKLNAEGRIGGKKCLVASDAGALVRVSLSDITAGLPEMDPTTPYVLQMTTGQTLPILKKALVKLPLGRRPLTTWVFVTNIAGEFTQGLNALRARDKYVDLRCAGLRLRDEEWPLWLPGARSHSRPLYDGYQREGSDSVC